MEHLGRQQIPLTGFLEGKGHITPHLSLHSYRIMTAKADLPAVTFRRALHSLYLTFHSSWHQIADYCLHMSTVLLEHKHSP